MENTLTEISCGNDLASLQSKVTMLQLQLERERFAYEQEINNLKFNSDLMLSEMRKSMEQEKTRLVNEIRSQCATERQRSIDETKKKQWCANCGLEAQFYCCWNTSYCDYPCQVIHWNTHSANCGQANKVQQHMSDTNQQERRSIAIIAASTDLSQTSNTRNRPVAINTYSATNNSNNNSVSVGFVNTVKNATVNNTSVINASGSTTSPMLTNTYIRNLPHIQTQRSEDINTQVSHFNCAVPCTNGNSSYCHSNNNWDGGKATTSAFNVPFPMQQQTQRATPNVRTTRSRNLPNNIIQATIPSISLQNGMINCGIGAAQLSTPNSYNLTTTSHINQ